jgi:succinate dehydrogenase hydrophobic anchor subunit
MATQATAGRRIRMGGSKFELYMWFFTRVSGILLLMILAGALAQLFGYKVTLLVLFAKVCVPIFALNV